MTAPVEYVGSEVNPAMANIVSPSEVVVVSTFSIDLDGGGGDLHITVPYSMIEPIREVLDAGMQSDVGDVDDRWQQSLREDILSVNVDMHGKVVQKKMSLRDVAKLKTGDIIPIDLPELFTLEAHNIPMFRGKLGVSDENLAVKIVDQINLKRR